MSSSRSAEERCTHRDGHLSKDGLPRSSDSGHLTAHKEQSRGQGGADMPNLNLRLVNDFIF